MQIDNIIILKSNFTQLMSGSFVFYYSLLYLYKFGQKRFLMALGHRADLFSSIGLHILARNHLICLFYQTDVKANDKSTVCITGCQYMHEMLQHYNCQLNCSEDCVYSPATINTHHSSSSHQYSMHDIQYHATQPWESLASGGNIISLRRTALLGPRSKLLLHPTQFRSGMECQHLKSLKLAMAYTFEAKWQLCLCCHLWYSSTVFPRFKGLPSLAQVNKFSYMNIYCINNANTFGIYQRRN